MLELELIATSSSSVGASSLSGRDKDALRMYGMRFDTLSLSPSKRNGLGKEEEEGLTWYEGIGLGNDEERGLGF